MKTSVTNNLPTVDGNGISLSYFPLYFHFKEGGIRHVSGKNELDYQNIGNQTITKMLEKEIQRLANIGECYLCPREENLSTLVRNVHKQ